MSTRAKPSGTIEAAIDNLKLRLPNGYRVAIDLAGGSLAEVTLFDPEDEPQDFDLKRGLAASIDSAVAAAIALEKRGGA